MLPLLDAGLLLVFSIRHSFKDFKTLKRGREKAGWKNCCRKLVPRLSTGPIGLRSDLDDDGMLTILGFGSLLSEKSSRLTFPDLVDFRLARVPNYRRVFAHPASIFFQQGIADLESLQISSLSVEYEKGHPGFVGSVFQVPTTEDLTEVGVPRAFLEREAEFDIVEVPFIDLGSDASSENGNSSDESCSQKGIICTRSTDEAYVERWGEERFNDQYRKYGVDTVWGWEKDSGLRPCAIYLRHCYLAAKSMGQECYDSFLNETYLVDRKTTIRQYLGEYPSVLDELPPPELASRYGG